MVFPLSVAPLLLCLLMFSSLFSSKAFASEPSLIPAPPKIGAKAYILVDAYSGKVIAEKNADKRLDPASLTKLMTSYIADYELNQGNISLNDEVTVSNNAWAKNFPGSSLMFLEVGKQVSVAELLKGVIISSGNDASVALAEHIAGSTDAFADIMNQHAQLLGMSNSSFENSHGLPHDNHYTTARDMAKLATTIVVNFTDGYNLYSQRSYMYNGIKQLNRNKLLWSDPNVDGLKTGYTRSAGYCLVASSQKDNMRLVAVVMGTKSRIDRERAVQQLLSYGYRYYKTIKLFEQGQAIENLRVWGGNTNSLPLVTLHDIYITIPRAQIDDVETLVKVESYVQAPLLRGQSLGSLKVNLHGETLLKVSLLARDNVDQGAFFKRLRDKLVLFFYQLLNGG